MIKFQIGFWVMEGFLNLNTIDIWEQTDLCCGGLSYVL